MTELSILWPHRYSLLTSMRRTCRLARNQKSWKVAIYVNPLYSGGGSMQKVWACSAGAQWCYGSLNFFSSLCKWIILLTLLHVSQTQGNYIWQPFESWHSDCTAIMSDHESRTYDFPACLAILAKWSTIHIMGFIGEVLESAAEDKWPEVNWQITRQRTWIWFCASSWFGVIKLFGTTVHILLQLYLVIPSIVQQLAFIIGYSYVRGMQNITTLTIRGRAL